MNLIGVIVLIILFACHKAQEFRRNPPIFTSTLSFESLPPFPATHFTRLTSSDETQQFLRTQFFENYRLPQAIWIFADNLRTAPCCEIGTQLTPIFEEDFTSPEASPPSFTPPEPSTFDLAPTPYTDNIYPTITVTLPQITTTTDDEMNEYFTGWGITVPHQSETIFTKEKNPNEILMGKLSSKKLISNQIDRIIGPPSIKPRTEMENFEINNGFEKKETTKEIGPPLTEPNEFELKTLNEKEQKAESVTDFAENVVTDEKSDITDMVKSKSVEQSTTSTATPSSLSTMSSSSTTKRTTKVNNVLMGIPKGTSSFILISK
uniref:Uncharacterized protein n=1 Tax=Panagrolaimus sp. PS1159 TaxID=55785 RepID=A0AC35ERG0_9BILA